MPTLREAAQQALAALDSGPLNTERFLALQALRQALEAELPPARSLTDDLMDCVDRLGSEHADVDPRVWDHLLVYAPAPQPLTEEQIKAAFLAVDLFEEGDELLGYEIDITRAIERIHGIIGEPK